MREKIGYMLLDLDDWLAGKGMYFNPFNKDENEHVGIIAKWGFNLILREEE